ncbi:hypothetical protein EC957_011392 [Mortierella hygrophila]|uniref:Uncharacterized protein n=1 Tax=Mortierella hygrophila TaxID=979708 RepID=A0A9P6FI98_9FUNG|nr:hypothetical protein EC957_011392 [Mortierella hygrophila]
MAVTSSLLPPASLAKLKTIEDRIEYKYSQDRIDQGLDQDGNDIDSYHSQQKGDDDEDQAFMNWLFKTLVRLEETAPPEEEEDESGNVVELEETEGEKEYRQEHEKLTERVSACVAHFCGRAASGAMTRTWTFRSNPPQSLKIHDPSFTGGDVGFKTFGSAYLLSKHIAQGDIPQLEPWTSESPIIPPSTQLAHPKILELGSGTGLVGFTAALYSNPNGPKVILSDYHPNVISTLHHNSKLNNLDSKCDIRLLDWRDILRKRKLRWNAWQHKGDEREQDTTTVETPHRSTEYDNLAPSSISAEPRDDETDCQELTESERMDLIIGAEVVYDHGHAELVAHVADEYLKKDLISDDTQIPLERRRPAFHIMFPLRKTHADVIADFDFWMDKMGLVDCRQAKEWGREDGETTFLYHWREYVRKEHLSA